jgi:hypothetical protein
LTQQKFSSKFLRPETCDLIRQAKIFYRKTNTFKKEPNGAIRPSNMRIWKGKEGGGKDLQILGGTNG